MTFLSLFHRAFREYMTEHHQEHLFNQLCEKITQHFVACSGGAFPPYLSLCLFIYIYVYLIFYPSLIDPLSLCVMSHLIAQLEFVRVRLNSGNPDKWKWQI